MNNNPKLEGALMQLVQRLNPEFLQNNGDLVAQFLEAFKEQEKSVSNSINLEEFGIESPDELLELVEIVPKYNGLIDEYEDLESAFRDLKQKETAQNYEIAQLKKILAKSEAEKKRYLSTLGEAKRAIQSLKQKAQQLQGQNQTLKMEIKTRDQWLDRMRYFEPQTGQAVPK